MKRAASRHDRAPRIAPTSDVIGCNGKRQYDSFKDASHVAAPGAQAQGRRAHGGLQVPAVPNVAHRRQWLGAGKEEGMSMVTIALLFDRYGPRMNMDQLAALMEVAPTTLYNQVSAAAVLERIAALESKVDELLAGAVQAGRAAALEEAAMVCEARQTPGTGSVAILNGAADAIRALASAQN